MRPCSSARTSAADRASPGRFTTIRPSCQEVASSCTSSTAVRTCSANGTADSMWSGLCHSSSTGSPTRSATAATASADSGCPKFTRITSDPSIEPLLERAALCLRDLQWTRVLLASDFVGPTPVLGLGLVVAGQPLDVGRSCGRTGPLRVRQSAHPMGAGQDPPLSKVLQQQLLRPVRRRSLLPPQKQEQRLQSLDVTQAPRVGGHRLAETMGVLQNHREELLSTALFDRLNLRRGQFPSGAPAGVASQPIDDMSHGLESYRAP